MPAQDDYDATEIGERLTPWLSEHLGALQGRRQPEHEVAADAVLGLLELAWRQASLGQTLELLIDDVARLAGLFARGADGPEREQIGAAPRVSADAQALEQLALFDQLLVQPRRLAVAEGHGQQVERMVAEHVQPAVLAICRQLPDVMDAQQELAASLPQFRPYATLDQRDIEECEQDVRTEFAAR